MTFIDYTILEIRYDLQSFLKTLRKTSEGIVETDGPKFSNKNLDLLLLLFDGLLCNLSVNSLPP